MISIKSKLPWLIAPFAMLGTAFGQDEAAAAITPTFTVNNLWIMLAAFLVFIMHLGFSTLEAGLTQKKNTVNILFKNVWILSVGLLTYYVIGFVLHYSDDWILDGIIGMPGVAGTDAAGLTPAYNEGYTYWTDFLFQGMFAATAATIVSGAVAERVKLSAFMIHSTILVAVGYTIAGSWHWGGGFLRQHGKPIHLTRPFHGLERNPCRSGLDYSRT
jgi:Amt family ammonium transporter